MHPGGASAALMSGLPEKRVKYESYFIDFFIGIFKIIL